MVVIVALVLDVLFAEPRRFHPLVGFGMLAQKLERLIYAPSISRGFIAVFCLVAPIAIFTVLVDRFPEAIVFDVVILYLAIGWTSLVEHAQRVRDALVRSDLHDARKKVGLMVSRDTSEMGQEDISRSAVESVLENGNDAIFGALFWYMAAGVPAVVVYRLVNTLDAMWGYRNPRYQYFGRAAARLDDVLNYVPARLTALSYSLVGNMGTAIYCWRKQGGNWSSPNAGPVMASGAGSLNVRLGGPAVYHGVLHRRPVLGQGESPHAGHIQEAIKLIRRALILWLLLMLVGDWISDRINLVF